MGNDSALCLTDGADGKKDDEHSNVMPIKAPPPPPDSTQPKKDVYSFPPGLVGQIAEFIYAAAPRPVPEIALAGAIGLIAGIAGKSYNISGTGLNQYVLLLAPSGTGKEGIASGIGKLMSYVSETVPSAWKFIGPSEIDNQKALIKYLSNTSNCFVSIVGEFGIQLKRMAAKNASSQRIGVRSMLLDLYNKSGEGQLLHPSIYSDRRRNTAVVQAPSFSLLCESTPDRYYEVLDEKMIAEGLLSRFTTIEYLGERPPLNKNHLAATPGLGVMESLSTLCSYSLTLNKQNRAVHIDVTPEAQKLIDEFDNFCDKNVNSKNVGVQYQLWSRAHIKSLKLAATVAVGCNSAEPCITLDMAAWAINLVTEDVKNLLMKFGSGEIVSDNDETKQLLRVVAAVNGYIGSPLSKVIGYIGNDMAKMHADKVVPYVYLQRLLNTSSIFKHDLSGPAESIKRTVNTLVERGFIKRVSRSDTLQKYGKFAACYTVTDGWAFSEEAMEGT